MTRSDAPVPAADRPTRLVFAHYRFDMVAIDSLSLGVFPGQTLRGAFGHALRFVACRGEQCRCRMGVPCDYEQLFTPRVPTELLAVTSNGVQAPVPFVVVAPPPHSAVAAGATFAWHMTLFGSALALLPAVIEAVQQLGRSGLGQRRSRLRLAQVWNASRGEPRLVYDASDGKYLGPMAPISAGEVWLSSPQHADAARLRFDTPVRIEREHDLCTALEFPVLAAALRRRASLLSALYGGETLDPVPLPETADIRTRWSRLAWSDLERFSERQQQTMRLGGLEGEICFEGQLGPELPWLRLGEHLHVGKATSFGHGRYSMTVD